MARKIEKAAPKAESAQALVQSVNGKEIVRCKYAGDPNDSNCCLCNGFSMEDGGKIYDCTMCGGYEPMEVPVEKPSRGTSRRPAPVNDTPVDDTEDETEDTDVEPVVEAEKPKARGRKPAAKQVAKPKPVEAEPVEDDVDDAVDEDQEDIVEPEPERHCKCACQPVDESDKIEISVTSGCTVEKKVNGESRWFKFEVSAKQTTTTDKQDELTAKLWAKVNLEVDNQVSEVENFVG